MDSLIAKYFVPVFPDYPDKAVNSIATYSGPLFSNVLEGDTYDTVTSFMDILALPETNTAISGWRRAYLSGELVCEEEELQEENQSKISSLILGRTGIEDMIAVCGDDLGYAFLFQVDVLKKPTCSTGEGLVVCRKQCSNLDCSW